MKGFLTKKWNDALRMQKSGSSASIHKMLSGAGLFWMFKNHRDQPVLMFHFIKKTGPFASVCLSHVLLSLSWFCYCFAMLRFRFGLVVSWECIQQQIQALAGLETPSLVFRVPCNDTDFSLLMVLFENFGNQHLLVFWCAVEWRRDVYLPKRLFAQIYTNLSSSAHVCKEKRLQRTGRSLRQQGSFWTLRMATSVIQIVWRWSNDIIVSVCCFCCWVPQRTHVPFVLSCFTFLEIESSLTFTKAIPRFREAFATENHLASPMAWSTCARLCRRWTMAPHPLGKSPQWSVEATCTWATGIVLVMTLCTKAFFVFWNNSSCVLLLGCFSCIRRQIYHTCLVLLNLTC